MNAPILLPYFNEIRNNTFLTKEEEYDLLHKAQSGDTKARDKIINANLLQVAKQAKKMAKNIDREPDLIQAGNIGLLMAIDKFDFKNDCRFITYALFHIKGQMLKELGDNMRTIYVPHNKQRMLIKGHINEEDLPRMSNIDVVDPIDYKNVSPDLGQKKVNKLVKQRIKQIIEECIPKERDKQILRLRFGIGNTEEEDDDKMNISKIARKLGMNKQLAQFIYESCLKKIKKKIKKEQLQSLLTLISDE